MPPASGTAAGPLSDFNNQISQPGAPVVPMYQPGGNLASWNPSTPSATNGSGLSVPMYWQGYYGPTGSVQTQQQSLLRPAQGLSMPPSMQPPSSQQLVQNSTIPNAASSTSFSQSIEFPPPLLQPIVSSSLSMQPNMHTVQSSALAADSLTNIMASKVPAQVEPVISQNNNSSFVSPALPNLLDKSTVPPLVSNQARPTSTTMPFNNLSENLSATGLKSTSPALVTPGQFLQPGPTISSSPQMQLKDVEVAQVSSMASSPIPSVVSATAAATVPVSNEAQGPLLPLPSPSNSKVL